MPSVKDHLFNACQEFIDKKIKSAQMGIDELQESADTETKSSVGDKYETNRAMIHIEREKFSAQLLESQKMQKVMAQIKTDKQSKKVALGSLVMTNLGNYYIAIAVGKTKIEGKDYFIISQASPIGQQFSGKTAGSEFEFNKRKYKIQEVL